MMKKKSTGFWCINTAHIFFIQTAEKYMIIYPGIPAGMIIGMKWKDIYMDSIYRFRLI